MGSSDSVVTAGRLAAGTEDENYRDVTLTFPQLHQSNLHINQRGAAICEAPCGSTEPSAWQPTTAQAANNNANDKTMKRIMAMCSQTDCSSAIRTD